MEDPATRFTLTALRQLQPVALLNQGGTWANYGRLYDQGFAVINEQVNLGGTFVPTEQKKDVWQFLWDGVRRCLDAQAGRQDFDMFLVGDRRAFQRCVVHYRASVFNDSLVQTFGVMTCVQGDPSHDLDLAVFREDVVWTTAPENIMLPQGFSMWTQEENGGSTLDAPAVAGAMQGVDVVPGGLDQAWRRQTPLEGTWEDSIAQAALAFIDAFVVARTPGALVQDRPHSDLWKCLPLTRVFWEGIQLPEVLPVQNLFPDLAIVTHLCTQCLQDDFVAVDSGYVRVWEGRAPIACLFSNQRLILNTCNALCDKFNEGARRALRRAPGRDVAHALLRFFLCFPPRGGQGFSRNPLQTFFVGLDPGEVEVPVSYSVLLDVLHTLVYNFMVHAVSTGVPMAPGPSGALHTVSLLALLATLRVGYSHITPDLCGTLLSKDPVCARDPIAAGKAGVLALVLVRLWTMVRTRAGFLGFLQDPEEGPRFEAGLANRNLMPQDSMAVFVMTPSRTLLVTIRASEFALHDFCTGTQVKVVCNTEPGVFQKMRNLLQTLTTVLVSMQAQSLVCPLASFRVLAAHAAPLVEEAGRAFDDVPGRLPGLGVAMAQYWEPSLVQAVKACLQWGTPEEVLIPVVDPALLHPEAWREVAADRVDKTSRRNAPLWDVLLAGVSAIHGADTYPRVLPRALPPGWRFAYDRPLALQTDIRLGTYAMRVGALHERRVEGGGPRPATIRFPACTAYEVLRDGVLTGDTQGSLALVRAALVPGEMADLGWLHRVQCATAMAMPLTTIDLLSPHLLKMFRNPKVVSPSAGAPSPFLYVNTVERQGGWAGWPPQSPLASYGIASRVHVHSSADGGVLLFLCVAIMVPPEPQDPGAPGAQGTAQGTGQGGNRVAVPLSVITETDVVLVRAGAQTVAAGASGLVQGALGIFHVVAQALLVARARGTLVVDAHLADVPLVALLVHPGSSTVVTVTGRGVNTAVTSLGRTWGFSTVSRVAVPLAYPAQGPDIGVEGDPRGKPPTFLDVQADVVLSMDPVVHVATLGAASKEWAGPYLVAASLGAPCVGVTQVPPEGALGRDRPPSFSIMDEVLGRSWVRKTVHTRDLCAPGVLDGFSANAWRGLRLDLDTTRATRVLHFGQLARAWAASRARVRGAHRTFTTCLAWGLAAVSSASIARVHLLNPRERRALIEGNRAVARGLGVALWADSPAFHWSVVQAVDTVHGFVESHTMPETPLQERTMTLLSRFRLLTAIVVWSHPLEFQGYVFSESVAPAPGAPAPAPGAPGAPAVGIEAYGAFETAKTLGPDKGPGPGLGISILKVNSTTCTRFPGQRLLFLPSAIMDKLKYQFRGVLPFILPTVPAKLVPVLRTQKRAIVSSCGWDARVQGAFDLALENTIRAVSVVLGVLQP